MFEVGHLDAEPHGGGQVFPGCPADFARLYRIRNVLKCSPGKPVANTLADEPGSLRNPVHILQASGYPLRIVCREGHILGTSAGKTFLTCCCAR